MIGLWHCKDCQHQWEGAGGNCGLCGGEKYLLAEVTCRGEVVERRGKAFRWRKRTWPRKGRKAVTETTARAKTSPDTSEVRMT